MPGHIVSIVRIGAGFATGHSDAGLSSRAGQLRGDVKIRHLVSE